MLEGLASTWRGCDQLQPAGSGLLLIAPMVTQSSIMTCRSDLLQQLSNLSTAAISCCHGATSFTVIALGRVCISSSAEVQVFQCNDSSAVGPTQSSQLAIELRFSARGELLAVTSGADVVCQSVTSVAKFVLPLFPSSGWQAVLGQLKSKEQQEERGAPHCMLLLPLHATQH